jgi:hypothetical protein
MVVGERFCLKHSDGVSAGSGFMIPLSLAVHPAATDGHGATGLTGAYGGTFAKGLCVFASISLPSG